MRLWLHMSLGNKDENVTYIYLIKQSTDELLSSQPWDMFLVLKGNIWPGELKNHFTEIEAVTRI